MKAVFGHYMVQCGTCGTGLKGEQHWFKSPSIIVHCQNPSCDEFEKKYHLPITRLELEPFLGPKDDLAYGFAPGRFEESIPKIHWPDTHDGYETLEVKPEDLLEGNPYIKTPPNTPEVSAAIIASLPNGEIPERWK